jgi:Protein of unknown function (DUF1524)
MVTINLLQMIQIRPLLLAVLDVFSVAEARQALRLMVSWGVRFLISGGLGGGTLERHYSDRATEIRSKTVKTAKQLAHALASIVPTDKQFEAAFANANVSKGYLARYYLQALEREHSGVAHPELIPNPNSDEVNLEHVLPVNPSGDWNHVPKDVATAYFNRIGNLALMQSEENALVGNEAFSQKKKSYAKSKIQLTRLIGQSKIWGVKEIERRQVLLAKRAIKAWPLK